MRFSLLSLAGLGGASRADGFALKGTTEGGGGGGGGGLGGCVERSLATTAEEEEEAPNADVAYRIRARFFHPPTHPPTPSPHHSARNRFFLLSGFFFFDSKHQHTHTHRALFASAKKGFVFDYAHECALVGERERERE